MSGYESDFDGLDSDVRAAAFQFLAEAIVIYGEALPRSLLQRGFELGGKRVSLVGPPGIFKPAGMRLPLTITTVPETTGKPRPYEDEWVSDRLLRYRYRGTDPNHRDNVGLRRAMETRTPLIYLEGTVPGEYAPVWPVYVVGDDPTALSFIVADSSEMLPAPSLGVAEARKEYAARLTKQRLHQVAFRQKVIFAYKERCAICRLRRKELLDAAHILRDVHEESLPIVPNGLALCKLHHAAFDRNIVGVRPDLVVEIRPDVLIEPDGPMLVHGLQAFHGHGISVPTRREWKPNRDYLARRYEEFRQAV